MHEASGCFIVNMSGSGVSEVLSRAIVYEIAPSHLYLHLSDVHVVTDLKMARRCHQVG